MAPFAEAGGIKDVVAGLSEALSQNGQSVTVVLPMYQFLSEFRENSPYLKFSLQFGERYEDIEIYRYIYDSIRIFFISAACYEKQQIYTYSRDEQSYNHKFLYGTGHLDCDLMNLVLQRSALEIPLLLGEHPHIFHLHDGHTGFLPAILKHNRRYKQYYRNTASLMTVHNAGIVYQQNIIGLNDARILTELPVSALKKIHTEHGYNPLLCAARYGHISTVSEKYAADIIGEADLHSGNLGSLLRACKGDFIGITNGISVDKYKIPLFDHVLEPDPESLDLDWKKEYKLALYEQLNCLKDENYSFGSLAGDPDLPLVTMQSRVTYQKGIDIFYESLPVLFEKNISANFLFIGEGEKVYEDRLADLAERYDNFCFIRKYDTVLSQRLFAAGDFFIIPSRWEPCGLTDFIAQLFGNIPIVHETGGLVKTKDGINGFSYKNNNGISLSLKIIEAVELFEKKSQLLHDMRKNAVNLINENYTWEKVAVKRYIPYYREILQK